jgi:hypothetical protein
MGANPGMPPVAKRMNPFDPLNPGVLAQFSQQVAANQIASTAHMVQRHPALAKLEWAIDNAIRQLPFALARKVQVVRSSGDPRREPWFEVVFIDGRILTFDNLDTFPTDADIARIALEAP